MSASPVKVKKAKKKMEDEKQNGGGKNGYQFLQDKEFYLHTYCRTKENPRSITKF